MPYEKKEANLVNSIKKATLPGYSITKSKRFSSIEYQKVLGTIERTAERDLKELIEKGLVSKKGVGKGTQYYF